MEVYYETQAVEMKKDYAFIESVRAAFEEIVCSISNKNRKLIRNIPSSRDYQF
jgi:hypothetical protein